MTVQSGNVERLMEWLADGSPSRSDALVVKLASLVFHCGSGWTEDTAQVETYRDALHTWFAGDDVHESQFVTLTGPYAEPGVLIDWLLRVLAERENSAYATPTHLAATAAASGDQAADGQSRYSERERDENYGLDYRYDHADGVYEWFDETDGTWKSQAWADGHVAERHGPSAQTPAVAVEAAWDENWTMFYRVGPGGVYEFADAVRPGEQASGCGEVWLSHEQVLARGAGQTASRHAGDAADSLRAEISAAVESALDEDPTLREVLSKEDIAGVIAEMMEG